MRWSMIPVAMCCDSRCPVNVRTSTAPSGCWECHPRRAPIKGLDHAGTAARRSLKTTGGPCRVSYGTERGPLLCVPLTSGAMVPKRSYRSVCEAMMLERIRSSSVKTAAVSLQEVSMARKSGLSCQGMYRRPVPRNLSISERYSNNFSAARSAYERLRENARRLPMVNTGKLSARLYRRIADSRESGLS